MSRFTRPKNLIYEENIEKKCPEADKVASEEETAKKKNKSNTLCAIGI